jgi:KaiC/GvpD/RAD55 family RecA-like ATPase
MLENMILMGNKVYTKESAEMQRAALLKGKVLTEKTTVAVGETFALEIQIANFGGAPAALDGIEEFVPCCGLELMNMPNSSQVVGSYLDLSGKVLESSEIEKLSFTVRALEKGTYIFTPRTVYIDGVGAQKIVSLNPATVEVTETILPDRLDTGFKDLNHLLFGGLPAKFAVVLASMSCDEVKLIVNRFLEKGAREGELTIHIAIDAGRWEQLAEKYPNFHLFVCNPQADIVSGRLPNVVKLRGVENLTDVSIPLFSALRKLETSDSKPKRICIEILSDILLHNGAVQTRRWLIGFVTELKSSEFTMLAIINPHMHQHEEVQAVLDLFDGEIEIYEEKNQKFLHVKKMYGQNYLKNEIALKKERLDNTGTAQRWRYHNY